MATEVEPTIRIYMREHDGRVQDQTTDFSPADFAGVLPAVGDTILYPGVTSGRDRNDPANRKVWKVVERVFNPRDLSDYVVLVVEERTANENDGWAYN